jgi:hypothetical protein
MSNIVIAFGLGLGTLLLGSVCWAYVTKHFFGLGGAVLSTFGLILVGMSVWNTVDVSVTGSGITAKLDSRLEKIEAGVAQAGQRTEAVTKQVGELSSKIESIDNKIVFIAQAGVDPSKMKKLAQVLPGYREYLKRIGYKDLHPDEQVKVMIWQNETTASYYDPSKSLIFINRDLIDHPDVLLSTYMYSVLYSGTDAGKYLPHSDEVLTWIDIGRALTDYFPASYLDSSAVYMDVDSWDLTDPLRFEGTRQPSQAGSNEYKCEPKKNRQGNCERNRPWTAAFWEIRAKLGRDVFDPLLFSGWFQLRPEEVDSGNGAPFVKKLMEADQGRHSEAIREIFARRGLEVAKL